MAEVTMCGCGKCKFFVAFPGRRKESERVVLCARALDFSIYHLLYN